MITPRSPWRIHPIFANCFIHNPIINDTSSLRADAIMTKSDTNMKANPVKLINNNPDQAATKASAAQSPTAYQSLNLNFLSDIASDHASDFVVPARTQIDQERYDSHPKTLV